MLPLKKTPLFLLNYLLFRNKRNNERNKKKKDARNDYNQLLDFQSNIGSLNQLLIISRSLARYWSGHVRYRYTVDSRYLEF